MNKYEYLTGRVIWFNRQRGYGMIAPDNRSPQVFFHHSVITGSGRNILFEGDLVEYILDFGRADFPEASEVWRRQPVAQQPVVPKPMTRPAPPPQIDLAPRAQPQARQPQRQTTLGAQRQAPQPQPQRRQPVPQQPQPVSSRRVDPISAQNMSQTGSSEHVIGTVLSFNRLKGFGFIEPIDGESPQVYVHFSALRGDGYQNLYVGDRVKYVPVNDGRGIQAKDVFVI